jgi:hypothetical protein
MGGGKLLRSPEAKRNVKKPDLRSLAFFFISKQTLEERKRLPLWFFFHANQVGNLPIVESLLLDPSIKPPEETG